MPFLLLFILFTYLIFSSEWYFKWYDVISELVVIFFCLRELRNSYVENKCKWQKASVYGVLTYCFLNIAYYLTHMQNVLKIQFAGVVVSILVVVYYMVMEKDESCNNC